MIRIAGVCIAFMGLTAGSTLAAAQETRFSTVASNDGVRLNVVETGDPAKPGLLFVHGNGQSYLSWSRQLDSHLANDFHLVAFDLRGHGASDKPWTPDAYTRACAWADDVAAVMSATGLNRPVLVAWSFGGAVAMHYVRCFGTANLSGLVLVGSRGGLVKVELPDSDSDARQSRELMKSDDFGDFVRGAEMFSRLMTAAQADLERTRDQIAMNLMVPAYARRAIDQGVTGPDGQPLRSNGDLVAKIDIPFLAILGSADPFRDTAELAAAFRAQMPQSEVKIIDGAGHSPFYESPAEFNSLLANFTRRANSR